MDLNFINLNARIENLNIFKTKKSIEIKTKLKQEQHLLLFKKIRLSLLFSSPHQFSDKNQIFILGYLKISSKKTIGLNFLAHKLFINLHELIQNN